MDTLLIDYLGAADNKFVRAVTRKTLCAAACRVLNPGCKFDTMLVLNGSQGIGKSTLIAKLGGESAPCSPAEFSKLIKLELAKYARIVKVSGARVD